MVFRGWAFTRVDNKGGTASPSNDILQQLLLAYTPRRSLPKARGQMEIRHYMGVLGRRAWIVAVAALLDVYKRQFSGHGRYTV